MVALGKSPIAVESSLLAAFLIHSQKAPIKAG
jgi:hypothetical protein